MSDNQQLINNDGREGELVNIPIEWYVPDELQTRYITNMTLQRTEHEFVLSFYEQRPPILFGSPAHIQTAASQLDSIRATCVARVVIANGRFPDIADVFKRALAEYQAEQAQEGNND